MKSNLERAAPAMLEALQLMVYQFGDSVWTSISDRDALMKARAAIALATQPDIDPVTGLPFNRDGEDE